MYKLKVVSRMCAQVVPLEETENRLAIASDGFTRALKTKSQYRHGFAMLPMASG